MAFYFSGTNHLSLNSFYMDELKKKIEALTPQNAGNNPVALDKK